MEHPVSPVVCLGEILVDSFWLGNQDQKMSLPGGAPANVACGLAKLGISVEFVGAVGVDAWGQALTRLLPDLQVGSRGLQRHPTAPTREVFVLTDEAGERSFAGFSLPDPAGFADAHLICDRIDPHLFNGIKYLVLGTLGLAYPQTRESILQAVEWSHQYNSRVVLDVNWRPMFWENPAQATGLVMDLLKHVSFLKLSDTEAQWLLDTTDPVEIAAQRPYLEGVMVTAGAAGCRYYLGGHSGYVSGFDVDVEDTTGAGDAFVAGFLHQLCTRGRSCLLDAECAHEVVRYASAVAALTTTRSGAIAGQPTPREVDAFLFLRN
ncbi:fructokinase [Leptolyngbya sp. Heron Island J]|uniref:carbohydrate kinase family protein n=1 Tax=Leptolyngbya sp. Heron Island J TaxID=1385935 RepID=UPI0003B98DB1|nr:carbohydrate kinase [Leptolyngbya sp. Heron Island J]ESA39037.1 fructokinase [Leptolyngbya sp. Heron Island J]